MQIKDLLALGATAAIAGLPSSARGETPTVRETPAVPGNECPEALRGASMKLATVRTDAVVLEFTAPTVTQRSDLRRLLQQTAASVEYLSKLAALDEDTKLVTVDGGTVPPLDISVRDVPAGAVVTVRTERPADGPRLVTLARLLRNYWDTNECVHGAVARTKAQ